MAVLFPRSIRRRTLMLVLLLLTVMTSAIAAISYRDATHEIEEIFDARLAQSARILQALVIGLYEADLHEDEERNLQQAFADALNDEAAISGIGHPYESKIAYQVWHGEQLLIRSNNAPDIIGHQSLPGFSRLYDEEFQWISFTLQTRSEHLPFVLIVSERDDIRGELVASVVWHTLIPELVGIPLLAFMLWLAIGWGLQPLKQLAMQIKRMNPARLRPITLSTPVSELIPVQQALNRLLDDTERLIAREQRLIADAAHELRTPLAVLRIHADNALNAGNEQDRNEALQHLRAGVERSTRVVGQLLTLARLEPDSEVVPAAVNVLEETRLQLAALMPLAWEKRIEIGLDADESLNWHMALEEGALETLLQNLISNAVKFSPAGTSIDVLLAQEVGHLLIRIVDHGPGVSPADKEHLAERFYRRGTQAGAGLGLSIVKRIAERHGGCLRVWDTPGGGLTVQAEFPIVCAVAAASNPVR